MSEGTVTLGENATITSGRVRMKVAPQLGGRITEFSLGARDILLPAAAVAGTENANNFGVTFWPSPQSAWGWPPLPEIDSLPYAGRSNEQELTLESQAATLPNGASILLTKQFSPVGGRDAIDVTYRLSNVGRVGVRLATWQIARVRSGGLTFFRLGPGGVTRDLLETQTHSGVQWYAYDPKVVVAQGQKTFADATGWVAHLEGELLLVQSFPDVLPGDFAPEEAEMELYSDPSHTYVEIEPQGRFEEIAPGARGSAWTVRFHLATLPGHVDAKVGSSALVDFVEQLIRG